MPKQILLVDDSVTIHRVVEITFAQEDFAITAVKSADEGLERAKQMKPDVVLADAGMAGKTGYDLCGALRQDGSLSKTACLILTGNFAPYDEAKGGSAGADGFVVKPFETQALIDKVKDAIAKRSGGAVASSGTAVPAQAPPPRVEALGKPLSTVAAETSARVPAPAPVAARPAPLPVPAAPVAAAPPPAQPQQRPAPKATLMGIPAVNPAAVGVVPPATAPTPPPGKVIQTPSQPIAVLQPPSPSKPIAVQQPPSPSQPIRVEPPKPAPAPAAPARVEPKPAAAPAATLPSNVPQMPRPSLVPGVAHTKGGNLDVAVSAAVAKLSREVIEQVVWEVVPELAETIIRAELDRLVRERQNA